MPPADLSYPEWLSYVFDHAVPFYEQAWYLEPETDWWRPQPEQALAYLARVFENPEPLADEFSDSQIAQGLHYLIDNGAGAYCRFLADDSVPLDARMACIEAMSTLFSRLFQPRCEPILSHPNDEATLVWVFDTSKMYCTHDIRHTVDESGCSDKWEVRA